MLLVVWAHGARADAALFDRLYESGDWQTLYAEIAKFDSPDELKAHAEWLSRRVHAGAPHTLIVMYGRMLFALGRNLKSETGLDMGVAFVTAGVAAAANDVIKCDDQKAAEARVIDTARSQGQLFGYVENRSREVRRKIRELVLSIEEKTADLRPLDPILCEMNVPRAVWQAKLAAKRHQTLRLIDALIPQD